MTGSFRFLFSMLRAVRDFDERYLSQRSPTNIGQSWPSMDLSRLTPQFHRPLATKALCHSRCRNILFGVELLESLDVPDFRIEEI